MTNGKNEIKSLKDELAIVHEDLEKVKQWREITSKYEMIKN